MLLVDGAGAGAGAGDDTAVDEVDTTDAGVVVVFGGCTIGDAVVLVA